MKKKILANISILLILCVFSTLITVQSQAVECSAPDNNISEPIKACTCEHRINLPDGSYLQLDENFNATLIKTVTISVTADGLTDTYRNVPVDTLANALDYLDIYVGEHDIINYDLTESIFDNQQINIIRVKFCETFETRSVNYKLEEVKDDNMLVGESKVVQIGKAGKERVKYKDTYFDGELAYRNFMDSKIIKEPQNKIVKVGTKNILVLQDTYSENSKAKSNKNEQLSVKAEISSNDIPCFNLTDTIGYISCNSAGLNSVPVTYGGDQWIIDSYDICMAHKYALPNYFGAGHSVVLAGHSTKSLGQLHKVSIGDTIEIRTVYGAYFTYKISYSELVRNYNNDTLLDMDTNEPVLDFNSSNDVLQIYTCVDNLGYDLNYRWLVKADLVDGTQII